MPAITGQHPMQRAGRADPDAFSAEFLGCKVSETDLEAVSGALVSQGLRITQGTASLHIINGCCVTAEAVRKTRQAARRAVATGARRVVITGCAAALPDAMRDLGPRVRVVAAASEHTPGMVVALAAGTASRRASAPDTPPRVRGFVKVQDGCSFGCAFCVIPSVRGRSRSRPLAEIVQEATRRVSGGQTELVLTGINIGLYRDPRTRAGLADVVRAVAAASGATRLRLSSIEPDHLQPPLVETLATTSILLPHLHVPLQSGDDGVLRAMRRRYTAARYQERLRAVRDAISGLNVTADVMIGFPGEDEHAFANTLTAVREAGLSRVHAFPYSARPATRTADDDPVSPLVKKQRSQQVRALADAQGDARRRGRIGLCDEVLVERYRNGVASGYGRDYTPWRVVAPAARRGALLTCRATGSDNAGMIGRPVAWT